MSSEDHKLSLPQKRFWASMKSPEEAMSEVNLVLEGELSPRRLQESIAAIVARHDILRTTFHYDSEEKAACQRVSSTVGGSVVRASLVQEGRTRHLLTLSIPALCADSATLSNLVSELRAIYAGSGAVLPAAVQYSVGSRQPNRDVEPEQVAQVHPLLLPFCRKAGPDTHFSPSAVRIDLDSDVVLKLRAIAFDFPTWLLAAWHVLLSRYSGQSEVTVACIVEGRGQGDGGAAFGRYAKPSPVSVTLEAGIPFRVVAEGLERAMARAADLAPCDPCWEATAGFAIEQKPRDAGAGGVNFAVSEWRPFPDRFSVMLRFEVDGDWLRAELLYDPLCFSEATVARMARSFVALLAAIAANPDASTDELSILGAEDWRQVVIDFNDTAAADFPKKCVHELFQDQVERTPHRTALRDRERSFTYRDLNHSANRLAHYLRKRGVGPNVPVGLYAERTANMIVGLLGILKAGGCYLALAPNDPGARIAHQLAEARAPILLTQREPLGALPEYGGRIVLLDEPFDTESDDNPETNTRLEDLIYVIYTSGSTGVPKGVATMHANVANYANHICRQLGLSQEPEGWHFATVSTICADLGNTSVFGALISGGCLHVIDYETAMSPKLFADYMHAHPIDLLKIAPSQMAALLDGAASRNVLPRRYVVMGGEKLSWQLVRQIRARSNCKIMNHYGPTETTIGCCTLVLDESKFAEWQPATVPLGRPIANDQVYILDRNLQPVPVGVAGELCMSGAGLSRGYLNQRNHNEERFMRHPFSGNPSARLYRTGDLARFLPDGNIEFLGRMDQQVKIRGFRVEPAEIEAALMRHPGIIRAAVLAGEGAHGETMLSAYLVASQSLDAPALRAHLAALIPDYMMPSRFVVVDEIPLTSNGKADTRALASFGGGAIEDFATAESPGNADEEKMAAIWMDVLGVDRIGIHDNFFELGGHSLLAMQIISRIRSEFGVQLPVRTFLLAPTVAESVSRLKECPPVPQQKELAQILEELERMSEDDADAAARQ